MRSISKLVAPLFACLVVVASGCEGEKPPQMHPVSGMVQYNGQPAAGVKVFLFPTSAPMVPQIPTNPHAVTDAQGKFTIGTYTATDGAAEGSYQIILLWIADASETEEPTETDKLFGWYDAKRSKLTYQVKSGTNTIPTINVPTLTGPPPESKGVPGRN